MVQSLPWLCRGAKHSRHTLHALASTSVSSGTVQDGALAGGSAPLLHSEHPSSGTDTFSEARALRRRLVNAICDPDHCSCGLLMQLTAAQLNELKSAVEAAAGPGPSSKLYWALEDASSKQDIARNISQMLTCYECPAPDPRYTEEHNGRSTHYIQPSDAQVHVFVRYMCNEAILKLFLAADLKEVCSKLGLPPSKPGARGKSVNHTKAENVARIRDLLQSGSVDSFLHGGEPREGAVGVRCAWPLAARDDGLTDGLTVRNNGAVSTSSPTSIDAATSETSSSVGFPVSGAQHSAVTEAARRDEATESCPETHAGRSQNVDIEEDDAPEKQQEDDVDVWGASAAVAAAMDARAEIHERDHEKVAAEAYSAAEKAMQAFIAQPRKTEWFESEASTARDAEQSWTLAACSPWIRKQRTYNETQVCPQLIHTLKTEQSIGIPRAKVRSHADGNPTGVSVTWLGTSSGAPTLNRNNSGILLRSGSGEKEALMLVDAGEGTMQQFQELGLDMAALEVVFLTHHHGDHIFGLPGLVAARYHRQQDTGKMTPLQIFGPPGTIQFCLQCIRIDSPLHTLTQDLPALDVTVTEWSISSNAAAAAAANRTVQSHGVNFTMRQRAPDQAHGRSPANGKGIHQFAYCKVTAVMDGYLPPEELRNRRMKEGRGVDEGEQVDAAQQSNGRSGNGGQNRSRKHSKGGFELGPGQFPLYDGLSWTVDVVQGWRVSAAQLRHRVPCWGYVFHEPEGTGSHRPRKVCLLGDTSDSRAIALLAHGCDLLSHESTFLKEMADKARIATHSTGLQAGQFASLVQAKTLVLTHFSGRYNSGQISSTAVEADSEDEQRRSLMLLKSEAEAGVLQGPRSSRSAPRAPVGGTDVTVACAFDGFTWRLPLEPSLNGKGISSNESSIEETESMEWVRQRSFMGQVHRGMSRVV